MECRICQAPSLAVGEKYGAYARRTFHLRRCGRCGFAFVEDPWLDYARIYDQAYYEGRGADPLVDYRFELSHPERTIRAYEWAGVLRVVQQLVPVEPGTRWLDFGCGNGGLVRHVRQQARCQAVGCEEGAIAPLAREAGIPVLAEAELAAREGSFDVVTAIEVLEHVVDPLSTLTRIRRLLRPGGLFFYTTGNARPHRDRLLRWQYFVPEIHVGLFEPSSMEEAMRRTGFEPRRTGFVPGWDRIVAFKVLKNLRRRTRSPLDRAIPWRMLAPIVNGRYGVYEFPVGLAG